MREETGGLVRGWGGEGCGGERGVGGRTVVVEPEENGEQQGKGDGEEDVADGNVPEVDEPAAVGGGLKGGAGRQVLEVDVLHPAHVDEPGEEDEGEWRPVILEKDANRVLEESALAERAAEVGYYKHE